MWIHVSLDDQPIADDLERGWEPFFWISWRVGDQSYPSADWTDFGTVVLGWWTWQLAQLVDEGGCALFAFMDGPYEIAAERVADGDLELRPEGEAYTWRITMIDVADALLKAVDSVIELLKPFPAANGHVAALQTDVSTLSRLQTKMKNADV